MRIKYPILLSLFGFFFLSCQTHRQQLLVTVSNELDSDRVEAVVEIPAENLQPFFSRSELSAVSVTDQSTGKELVSQAIDYDQDSRYDELIFQTNVAANETKSFLLKNNRLKK